MARTRAAAASVTTNTCSGTPSSRNLRLVGKPDSENDPQLGSLHADMSRKFEELVKEAEVHVSLMAATFLEVPQYRLPGAEEAVRQMSEKLKGQVDTLEPMRADLDREVRGAYGRVLQAIGGLTATGIGDLAETLALLVPPATAFSGLPETLKQRIHRRLGAALAEESKDPESTHLSSEERRTIRRILSRTVGGLPAGW